MTTAEEESSSMTEALVKRRRPVPSVSAHAGRVVSDDPFIRWLRSQPVPRELMFDILQASSKYDRASLMADAHAAHIRALRRGRRSNAQSSRSRRWSRGVSTDVAVGAATVVAEEADPWSADPWSRRVPTVVVEAERFESLLEQVRELRRCVDEFTRVRERADGNGRARAD
jgi:hypothetical protein